MVCVKHAEGDVYLLTPIFAIPIHI